MQLFAEAIRTVRAVAICTIYISRLANQGVRQAAIQEVDRHQLGQEGQRQRGHHRRQEPVDKAEGSSSRL